MELQPFTLEALTPHMPCPLTPHTHLAARTRCDSQLPPHRTRHGPHLAPAHAMAAPPLPSIQVESHHRWKTSQNFMAKLYTTQHEHCVIGVQILDMTSSGGHRFKVRSLIQYNLI